MDRSLRLSDDWKTPRCLYDELDKKFRFDFDPCIMKKDGNQR